MMAPLNFSSPPKPKLAFSIDSIVGSSEGESPKSITSQPSHGRSVTPPSPVAVVSTPHSSGCSPVASSWSSPSASASQLVESTASQFAALQQLHSVRQLRAAADQMAAHPLLARASQLPGLPFLPGGMLPGQRPAAAVAAVAAAAGLAPPHLMAAFPPHSAPHPHPPHPHQIQQTEYPLLPWLHSRHGRLFPTARFPGPDFPAFLLQPFRKPKRIRTAFSPSQLLKLEHAFEKNHYVVGQERKQLAQSLNLSETQVKVWFQNRRTKHKRVQEEDDTKDGSEKILLDDSSDQLMSYEKSDDEDNIDIDGDTVCDTESNSPFHV